MFHQPTNEQIVRQWDISPDWALFLDRDGVINKDMQSIYVKGIEQFTFIDKVPESIAQLRKYFSRIIVVTNQQGIGKGLVTHQEVQSLFVHIQNTLAPLGGSIDAFYYCPHLAVVHCLCRKPRIGMALQARIDFPGIDYTKAVIVGDRATDIEFGKKLGMKTVFVTNNEPLLPKQIPPADIICTNLPEFADILLGTV